MLKAEDSDVQAWKDLRDIVDKPGEGHPFKKVLANLESTFEKVEDNWFFKAINEHQTAVYEAEKAERFKNIDECAFIIDNRTDNIKNNSKYKDIKNTAPLQNPITLKKCSTPYTQIEQKPGVNPNIEFLPPKKEESFSNISTIPNDSLVEIYIGALSMLLLLLFLNIYKRHS